MIFPSKETAAHIRTQYPKGARVELVFLDDPHSKLSPGDRGEVVSVDDTGTVHIAWDCGSCLGAVYGEDVIKLVKEDS